MLLLTLLAVVAAILPCNAQAPVSKCVFGARRTGVKSIVDTNIEDVFGNGEDDAGAGDDDCVCVAHHQCDNGEDTIDMKTNGVCEDFLEECCMLEHRVGPILQPTLPPTPRSCGHRNVAGVGMRINGNDAGEAQFAEFPWMVALLEIVQGNNETFSGGGSLIHPTVVLTAAHSVAKFVADPSALRVRVGEWDTQSLSEPLPYQQLEVKEVVIHENYFHGALHNDIALLVLQDPALLAGNVATVCLPEQNEDFSSSTCVVTGWGKNEFGAAGCYQVILKSIELPIVRPEVCQRQLRTTQLAQKFRLHSSVLCAGGEAGVDACGGDGGGPLACPRTNTHGETSYVQAGVVSWGIGCGDANVPGIYANVARFRTWIDDRFAERRLDSASYRRQV